MMLLKLLCYTILNRKHLDTIILGGVKMKLTKSISSMLCLALVLSLSPVAYANEISRTTVENTLVGQDRYQTAVEVSKKGWSSANEAVVVNSESIVDALAVTPFAKLKNAPILLTEKII